MSHVIELKIKLSDPAALRDAAQVLGLELTESQTVSFYSASVTGTAIRLPEWRYPVIVEADGTVRYDNYDGRWGDIATLNNLVQEYTAQIVESQARAAGQYAWREEREDGTLVLRVGSY